MNNTIRIGTRGSDLALWQANYVRAELEKAGHSVELNIIKTQGDRIQHLSFDKMEGKGFFTKEIEAALLSGEVDLAVHSHKDLETSQPDGLEIAAVPPRAAVDDILIIRSHAWDESQLFRVKEGSTIGTSSARRKAMLQHHMPSCKITDLRGNVPTRIQKLRVGNYDAIVLAAAGVERLGLDLSDLLVYHCNPQLFVPAPAQGALGLQVRSDDAATRAALSVLHHEETAQRIHIEREILKQTGGGCHVPLGAFTRKTGNGWHTKAFHQKEAGAPVVWAEHEGPDSSAAVVDILKQLHG